MKIAAVSITQNDFVRIGDWAKHLKEYEDELYRHIIVDNNSTDDYKHLLHQTFQRSEIIELPFNGGCTTAYNRGISLALEDPEVDAILLVGNDVRIERGGLSKLYDLLFSKVEYGMAGTVVLKKDSLIIESCGIDIDEKSGASTIHEKDKDLKDVSFNVKEVTCVPGGANLSKAEMYRVVGLQDEKLFMYCDERDMGLRIKKSGYKEVVTSQIKCWHQHISLQTNGEQRNPKTRYLMGRNFIYLAKKHFKKRVVIKDFIRRVLTQTAIAIYNIDKKAYRHNYYYYMTGMLDALRGKMDNSQFM